MNLLKAKTLLEEEFGWTVEIRMLEQVKKIKVTKPDGEVEHLQEWELVQVAEEMWFTAKENGLDSEYVKEVETSIR